MGVTQDDTDLRRGGTTLGEAADLLDDLLRRGLQPGRGGARVGGDRRADTLSLGVKTTHFGGGWRLGILALVGIDALGRVESRKVAELQMSKIGKSCGSAAKITPGVG